MWQYYDAQLKFKLSVSNPTITKFYCLPKIKIHEPGRSARQIVSAFDSPTFLRPKLQNGCQIVFQLAIQSTSYIKLKMSKRWLKFGFP